MDKVKIGVLGASRGMMAMKYCNHSDNAELVAVCDYYEPILKRVEKRLGEDAKHVTFYTDFEEFLKHDMDAVILANYATEHAPFAIRCLEAGKHVMSEVLPCETLQEAVQLVEAVEKSDMIYAYAENYCFMPAPREIRRMYREGVLGEFEYGEGEYFHNCEPIWEDLTHGNPEHWRNIMPATFYCTHSIGPLLHITGLRPVKVTAFELPTKDRLLNKGFRDGMAAIEILELENGAFIKSGHGNVFRNSVWYTVYGSKGRMESAREDVPDAGGVTRLYCNYKDENGENKEYNYLPTDELSDKAEEYGHGGSDYYTTWNFCEKILGNPNADVIDVYEALDMSLPGIMGYRSVLSGGQPVEIPNFRHGADRARYRFDTTCTTRKKAGDMYVPSYSKGDLHIPDSVYQKVHDEWMKLEIERNKILEEK